MLPEESEKVGGAWRLAPVTNFLLKLDSPAYKILIES